MARLKVLLADDEIDFRRPLAAELREREGWEVEEFTTVAAATKAGIRGDYDVAIVDIVFPREIPEDGVTFFQKMKGQQKKTVVVFITGYADLDSAISALRLGAADYIKKPFTTRELIQVAYRAFTIQLLEHQMSALARVAAAPGVETGIDLLIQYIVRSAAMGMGRGQFLAWLAVDGEWAVKAFESTAPERDAAEDVSAITEKHWLRDDLQRVLETHEATVLREALGERQESREAPWARALALVPVIEQEKPTALLCAGSDEADAFGADDIRFLTTVAGIAGLEIERLSQWFSRQRAEAAKARAEAEVQAYRILPPGIAHHMNQPLTVIKGRTQRLLEAPWPKPDWARPELEAIAKNARRIEALIDQMLDLVRVTRLSLSRTDLNTLLESCLTSLQEEVKSTPDAPRIKIAHQFCEELPSIQGDKVQLEMAFTCILRNGFEAVRQRVQKEPGYKGCVEVATSLNGLQVVVEVEDNGVGMTEEQKRRAFEPLYSAKAKGHGLGLSVARLVIASHGGSTDIRSKPYEGTTVRITLPVEPAPESTPQAEAEKQDGKR